MNRHEAREAALGLVFEKAFKPLEETDKLYELAKLERELEEDEYVRRVTNGVFENLERIDSLIEASAKGWKINRMPKVDAIVETPDGDGVVVETNPLAGYLKVHLRSDPDAAAPKVYAAESIKKIKGYIKRERKEEIDEELKALEKE